MTAPSGHGGEVRAATDEAVLRYEAPGLVVEWRPGRCVHSARCVRGLPAVFDAARRPWVDATAAPPETIAATIDRCPSGALRAHLVGAPGTPVPPAPATVEAHESGQLHVRGALVVRDAAGRVLREDTRLVLCGCGRSGAIPFCDAACERGPAAATPA